MAAVALAGTLISNVWESPTITVTDPLPPPLALDISSTFLLPESILTGGSVTYPVTLYNPSLEGAPGYDAVLIEITISDIDDDLIAPGDVTLIGNDGTASYPVTLVQGTVPGELTGTWGPAIGFPVPPQWTATTNFTATFLKAGEYKATAVAVDLTP